MLSELFSVDDQARNEAWENKVLENLSKDFVRVIDPAPKSGPDGFPYLFCETDSAANEPLLKIIEWLSDKGIGLAINPQKPSPDFVLTYGMLWNFRQTGRFLSSPAGASSSGTSTTATRNESVVPAEVGLVLPEGTSVFTGNPSEEYFPQYVRSILKEFLFEQGIVAPRVLMISKDKEHYDLCFSLESLGNPPEAERQGILEALSWFFPAHYSLALVSESSLPPFLRL